MGVMVEAKPPHDVLGYSPPFRLPDFRGKKVPMQMDARDIQLATGLLALPDGSFMITYSVGDCVSMVTRFSSYQELAPPSHETKNAFLLDDVAEVINVRLEGPFRSRDRYAKVNWEIASALQAKDRLLLSIEDLAQKKDREELEGSEDVEAVDFLKFNFVEGNRLQARSSSMANVTIRHFWPPAFHRPVHGKLITYFDWEFYHVPTEWAEAMVHDVDDIWVPTKFVKNGLVESGVPEDKITVITPGLKASTVCPSPTEENEEEEQNRKDLRKRVDYACGENALVFLYHGAMMRRKGADAALSAYLDEFNDTDPVCFVVHSEQGEDEAWDALKAAMPEKLHAPKVVVLEDALSSSEVTELFALSDVFVHVSRAESFGVNIAEAMACGLPVITTDKGAVADFTSNDTVWQVESKMAKCKVYPCGEDGTVFGMKMAKPPLWMDFKKAHLGKTMRDAGNMVELRRERATRAREFILKNMTAHVSRTLMLERTRKISSPARNVTVQGHLNNTNSSNMTEDNAQNMTKNAATDPMLEFLRA